MDEGNAKFVERLQELLSLRGESTLLVILHSGEGMDVMSNTNDLPMKLGMLEVARMTTVDAHQAVMEANREAGMRKARETALAMSGKPGRMN